MSLDAYKGEIKRLCAFIRRVLDVQKAEADLQDAAYFVLPTKTFCRLVEREQVSFELDGKLEAALKQLAELCESNPSRLALALKWIYRGGSDLPPLSLEEYQNISKAL